MYKRKSFFITFEGIEGSGKSFQSKKLYKNIKSLNLPVIFTREPGGSDSAETIRKIILSGKKDKFSKTTDTLLYLASRNEHIKKTLIPAIKKNKNIICDRFFDSTIAYQAYGKGVDKQLIDFIHKKIVKNIKPDITFILKVKISKAIKRLKKRKNLNRYDKFSKDFYQKVQRGFIKIAKSNSKRCIILDTSIDSPLTEKVIFRTFVRMLSK